MRIDENLDNEKIIIMKDNKEVECDILFTFDSDDTGKAYIGYTDHSLDDKGKQNIYVSSIDPIKGIDELQQITDPLELDMVDRFIKDVMKNFKG